MPLFPIFLFFIFPSNISDFFLCYLREILKIKTKMAQHGVITWTLRYTVW